MPNTLDQVRVCDYCGAIFSSPLPRADGKKPDYVFCSTLCLRLKRGQMDAEAKE